METLLVSSFVIRKEFNDLRNNTMESIYKLQGRVEEIAARYDEVMEEFENLMEENGGELNEESQDMLDKIAELEAIHQQIAEDFIKFPDAYASWYKNEEAKEKVAEAELKAFKEMQEVALAKYKARVTRRKNRKDWIKQNIEECMRLAGVEKFDKKSNPDALHSIYFQETKSIEVDEVLATQGYAEVIKTANSVLPEGFSLVLKVDKSVLKKAETLPIGVERKVSKSLQIR